MSKVETRRNITEIQAIPLSSMVSNVSRTASVVSNAVVTMTDAAIKEMITGNVNLQASTLKSEMGSTALYSPVNLRQQFSEIYTSSITEFSGVKEVLTRQKAAALKTISSCDYQVQSPATIQQGITQIMQADAQQSFSRAVESVMNEIQAQHNQVFTHHLSSIVKEASIKSGFAKEVKVKVLNQKLSVIATNEHGQALLSEIQVDKKSQRLDLVTETIGISDGSCNVILQKFGEELEKAGVKYGESSSKWTGGACWLPNSKAIEKEIQGKKKIHSKNKARTKRLAAIKANKNRIQ